MSDFRELNETVKKVLGEEWIVAINAGTPDRPGWNNGGVFPSRREAQAAADRLERTSKVSTMVVNREPWTGTIRF